MDMDSGLGSDDDRCRTKEQKQRLNQQLLSHQRSAAAAGTTAVTSSRPGSGFGMATNIINNGTSATPVTPPNPIPTAAASGHCFIDASSLCCDDDDTAAVQLVSSSSSTPKLIAVGNDIHHRHHHAVPPVLSQSPLTCYQPQAPPVINNVSSAPSTTTAANERRQGALLFQSSGTIAQYSTMHEPPVAIMNGDLVGVGVLGMCGGSDDVGVGDKKLEEAGAMGDMTQQQQLQHQQQQQRFGNGYGDVVKERQRSPPDTPYNSIVNLEHLSGAARGNDATSMPIVTPKPLGFYVDLTEDLIDHDAQENANNKDNAAQKNIFSMVIDFAAPKKEKPNSLGRLRRRSAAGSSNGSSDVSLNGTITSTSTTTTSTTTVTAPDSDASSELVATKKNGNTGVVVEHDPSARLRHPHHHASGGKVKDARLTVVNGRGGHKADLTAAAVTTNSVKFVRLSDLEPPPVVQPAPTTITSIPVTAHNDTTTRLDPTATLISPPLSPNSTTSSHTTTALSDLDYQHPNASSTHSSQKSATCAATTRMSRSIPECSWLESPLSLLMTRSTGYRLVAGTGGNCDGGGTATRTLTSVENSATSLMSRSGERANLEQRRRGGTDLLRLFLEEVDTDVVLYVAGRAVKAHRNVLISRCQYFAGSLRGRSLTLDGFSYEAVHHALCHIYAGSTHVPDSISLVELASLADLLTLEGLKEVVAQALSSKHCHHFHSPCSGCLTGVLEVLPLAAAYGLDDLYYACVRWSAQHYTRVWPTRTFASLSRDLRAKCCTYHTVHLQPDTVLPTLLSTERLRDGLTGDRWAEPVRQLTNQLLDACGTYVRTHMAAVLTFLPLVDTWQLARCEGTLLAAATPGAGLTMDQACRTYGVCYMLLQQCEHQQPSVSSTTSSKVLDSSTASSTATSVNHSIIRCSVASSSPILIGLLRRVAGALETLLASRPDRLSRCAAWARLEPALQERVRNVVAEATSRPQSQRHLSVSGSLALTSSSDSSRNSSPAAGGGQQHHHHAGATSSSGLISSHQSPSLRRSLLLAARAPQPSASSTAVNCQVSSTTQTSMSIGNTNTTQQHNKETVIMRRSNLTRPTQASAAKSAKTTSSSTSTGNNKVSSGTKTKGGLMSTSKSKPTAKSATGLVHSKSTNNAKTIVNGSSSTGTGLDKSQSLEMRLGGSGPRVEGAADSPASVRRQIPVLVRKSESPVVGRKSYSANATTCQPSPTAAPRYQHQRHGSAGSGPVQSRYMLPRQRPTVPSESPTKVGSPVKMQRKVMVTSTGSSCGAPCGESPRLRSRKAQNADSTYSSRCADSTTTSSSAVMRSPKKARQDDSIKTAKSKQKEDQRGKQQKVADYDIGAPISLRTLIEAADHAHVVPMLQRSGTFLMDEPSMPSLSLPCEE